MFIRQNKVIDNKEILVTLGDSTSAGTNGSTGNASFPPAGQARYLIRSPLGLKAMTPDVVGSGFGTPYPKAITTYYNNTKKRITVVPTGVGGSFVSNTGTNWSSSGTLYALMQTDIVNAIAMTEKSLKGFFISVAINDIANGVSLATIQSDYDDLLTRIQTDYPNVPICLDKNGSTTGYANLAAMQTWIETKASSLITVINGMNGCVSGGYMADTLHPNQNGNEIVRAPLIGNWLTGI